MPCATKHVPAAVGAVATAIGVVAAAVSTLDPTTNASVVGTILVSVLMSQLQGAKAYSDDYGEGSDIVMQCAARSEVKESTAISPAVLILLMIVLFLGLAVKWLMCEQAILKRSITELEARITKYESKKVCERRSVCTQSMCTYNRKVTQPRFVVLHERETEPFAMKEFVSSGFS